MIGKKMEKAFNDQLNAELYSSYLYLSMAAYFESQNLKGMAGWMRCAACIQLRPPHVQRTDLHPPAANADVP